MQSLLTRAATLGFVSKNQEQYLRVKIGKNGLRTREPPELDFPAEKPTVLESIIQVHRDALGYSDSDLARFLHMFESDLYQQYQLTPKKQDRPRLSIVK
jgi:hypothetical protein